VVWLLLTFSPLPAKLLPCFILDSGFLRIVGKYKERELVKRRNLQALSVNQWLPIRPVQEANGSHLPRVIR